MNFHQIDELLGYSYPWISSNLLEMMDLSSMNSHIISRICGRFMDEFGMKLEVSRKFDPLLRPPKFFQEIPSFVSVFTLKCPFWRLSRRAKNVWKSLKIEHFNLSSHHTKSPTFSSGGLRPPPPKWEICSDVNSDATSFDGILPPSAGPSW